MKFINLNSNYLIKNFEDIYTTNYLNLSQNEIQIIEENTFEISNNLLELDLSSNKISMIQNDSFKGLDQLKTLNLSNNQIKELIDTFALKNIKNLDLSNNLIDMIIFRENLQNLVNLNLSDNKLTYIERKMFGHLNQLKIINLSHNQIMRIQNDSFEGLNKLKQLNLSYNKIEDLNFSVDRNLETLNLSFNHLNKINNNFFNQLENLAILYLQNNNIEEVGIDTFKCLSNLIELNLSNNSMKKLNISIFNNLKNLKTLFIDNNKISEIKNDVKNNSLIYNLSELSLSNNLLEKIDNDSFENLINLSDLNLSNNKINKIDNDSFKKLSNIKRLYLLNNLIDNVLFLDSITSIQLINLFNNFIKEIEISFVNFNNLNILELSNNQLQSFDLGKLPKNIKKIYLDNNQIEYIEYNATSEETNSIEILHLNGNNLSKKFNNNKHDLHKMISQLYNQNQNKQLKEFYLFKNGFDDEFMIDLKTEFKNLKTCYSLNALGYCKAIKLDSHLKKKYPQLKNFQWDEIPMFSVITGKNGSGKSTILEMIQNDITNLLTPDENNTFIFPILLKIHDKIISNDQKIDEYINNLNKHGLNEYQLKYEEIRSKNNFESPNSLGSSILSFYSIQLAVKYLKYDLIKLNKFLKAENFKYKVILNEENVILYVEFINQNNIIEESNLSPGEKTILLFLIWKYIYEKYKLFGKTILLLDEPDSHLHPKAVNEIIRIIKQLVELGIQVVMTTHNPTTISLINNKNLFLLSNYTKDKKIEISRTQNKLNLYKYLTPNNLINVENFFKIVLVEGKTDLPFYNLIYEQLKEEKTITDDILLIFQPLQEQFRNKNQVLDLIKKIKDKKSYSIDKCEEVKTESDYFKRKLQSLIYAIVDDDNDKYRKNRINSYDCLYYLNRYSFENYLWDPFNLISFFIYNKESGFTIRIKGKVFKLRIRQVFLNLIEKIIKKNQIKENKQMVGKILDQNSLNRVENYILNEIFEPFKINTDIRLINYEPESMSMPLIFQLKLNLYKMYDLYVNSRQTNPLNEFLDSDGYQFDPFKEYLRLKWMENYLYLERCPHTSRFQRMNSKIYNSLKHKIDLDLDEIFQKLKNSFEFEKMLKKNKKELFNQSMDLKDAFLNAFLSDGITQFEIKDIKIFAKLIKNIINKLIIKYQSKLEKKEKKEFIHKLDIAEEILNLKGCDKKSDYYILLLNKFGINLDENEKDNFLIIVRECINDFLKQFERDMIKKTMQESFTIYIENFHDCVRQMFMSETNEILILIKNTIHLEYVQELKEIFKEKYVVEFGKTNEKIKYSVFFFKMRGHDLEKIYHKIFLEQDSPNIFYTDRMNDSIEVFKKIGLILPNDLKDIFKELTSRTDE